MGEDSAELIPAYVETTETLIGELEEAYDKADRETVFRLAHTLKSNSASVGAMRLSGLARELEEQARTRQTERFAVPVATLRTEYTRVREALLKYAA